MKITLYLNFLSYTPSPHEFRLKGGWCRNCLLMQLWHCTQREIFSTIGTSSYLLIKQNNCYGSSNTSQKCWIGKWGKEASKSYLPYSKVHLRCDERLSLMLITACCAFCILVPSPESSPCLLHTAIQKSQLQMGAQFKIMSQSQLIFLVFTVITLILMNPSIINVNVTSASIAFFTWIPY